MAFRFTNYSCLLHPSNSQSSVPVLFDDGVVAAVIDGVSFYEYDIRMFFLPRRTCNNNFFHPLLNLMMTLLPDRRPRELVLSKKGTTVLF
jgi:hypothetical protein